MANEDDVDRSLRPGRLQEIMDSRRQPDGSRWGPAAVARELTRRGGKPISRQYISRLASQGGDPGFDLITALCDLFDVSADTFRTQDQPREPGPLAGLMYRAGRLDASGQAELASFIAWKESQQQGDGRGD